MKYLLVLTAMLATSLAQADQADVLDVRAERTTEGIYRFDVTIRHADNGWDHYADKWDIVGPDGTVYGTRVLLHPHVGEQPFTRGLDGVRIPEQVRQVTVRAHDSVHGYGGREMRVEIPQ